MSDRRRILVAMSGGVDSAVAAARLRAEGYDVGGVTFKLFCYGDAASSAKACCGLEGVRDAQSVARRLGVPHVVLDLSEAFRAKVFDDFTAEYARARTPNPCVQCNTHIKFGPLLDWARQNGYDEIATGHYVRLEDYPGSASSGPLLRRAVDAAKDQSYVLWGLAPAWLAHTRFPLGGLSKSEVRADAQALGLPVWDKAESQDICFVEGRDYAEVVLEAIGAEHPSNREGEIRDAEGRSLGRHRGLIHYTVGQRRGLGLGGGDRHHVLALEPETNTLRVGSAEALLTPALVVRDLNLFVSREELARAPVSVKIRYRHTPAPARVEVRDDELWVRFEEPQGAVAPGQSCVVYREDFVLAGGRIERALASVDETGT